MEPDELYTLRAQYWLGHYNLCLEETKAVARRPMSAELKVEREEFALRALLAMKQYDRVISESSLSDAPGIKAIGLKAQYESPSTPETSKPGILSSLQTLVSDPSTTATAQLIAAQTFLAHGEMTKEALQCVHLGTTMEHLALAIQIYLRMDRLDLAIQTLATMKSKDEEAVVTQLCACYIHVATGRSQALDAVHLLGSLTEQYGASPMLLNLTAVANMTAGQYAEAEISLNEASNEGEDVDTLINLIVCYQQMGKPMESIAPVLDKVRSLFPNHPFVQGLDRVGAAFEREAVKYKVAA
jgi:coatomer protein complex subunit epsilon